MSGPSHPANGNSNPNNQQIDKGYFCAACGSSDVTASALSGGEARCNVCNWSGRVEELAVFAFSHDMGTAEEVYRRFFMDLRQLLARGFAVQIGLMLIKWGFIDSPTDKNQEIVKYRMARYLAGIARAIADGVVRTRADIEREEHREQTPTRS